MRKGPLHHLILSTALLLSTALAARGQEAPDSVALADSAKLLSEQAEQAYQQGTRESYDRAIALLLESRELCQRVGDRRGEGRAMKSMGNVHKDLGRPDSALAYYRQALAIDREVGDRRGEGETLNNLGAVHSDLGRPDSALVYYRRALAVEREVGDRGGQGASLDNIGHVYRSLGRPDSARTYYRRALRISREVGDRGLEGHALGSIGNVHRVLGRTDSALAYYRQALNIARESEERASEGIALSNIGSLLIDLGHPDSALVYYRQALAISREVGDRQGESIRLQKLAQLQHRRLSVRDRLTAVAYYDSAAAVRASIAAHAGSDPNRLSYAEQYTGLFEDWALAWAARTDEVGTGQAARAALAVAERGRAQALLDLMLTSAGGAGGVVSSLQALTKPGADLAEEGARLAEAVTHAGAAGLTYLMTEDTLLVWLIEPSGEVSVARRQVSRDSVVMLVRALRAGLGVDDATAGAKLALRGALELEAPVETEAGAPPHRGLRYAETAAAALTELLLPGELADRFPEAGELVIVPQGPLALVPFSGEPVVSRPSGTASPSATPHRWPRWIWPSGDPAWARVRSGTRR